MVFFQYTIPQFAGLRTNSETIKPMGEITGELEQVSVEEPNDIRSVSKNPFDRRITGTEKLVNPWPVAKKSNSFTPNCNKINLKRSSI